MIFGGKVCQIVPENFQLYLELMVMVSTNSSDKA